MPDFFQLQSGLFIIISLICLVVKVFALFDCVRRAPSAFGYSMSKNAWLVILVLALIAHILIPSPLSLFNLVGTLAALVYLAQQRGSRVI